MPGDRRAPARRSRPHPRIRTGPCAVGGSHVGRSPGAKRGAGTRTCGSRAVSQLREPTWRARGAWPEAAGTAAFLTCARAVTTLRLPFSAGVCWRSSMVEHLICNEVVGGSSPFASSAAPPRSQAAGAGEVRAPATTSAAGPAGAPLSAVSRWHHERESRRGGVPERPKGADCKSAGSRLRRFESFPLHHPPSLPGSVDPARVPSAPDVSHWAGIAQRLEHRPSKPRVAGSNPVSRSII